ncbi:hypothetical protein FALBO_8083 [Fusarium albosuccineum]|uniref:Uncharacterized protein n=1 Tax=Fusarium albosuccineum TaxID=1237068 RepID=A0A8H4LBC3_9HYPO|nr:hypothetical protein FALBO_8083 [Fusarium albosuccineum]
MAPSEFQIRLQKGITGGFAPPTPSLILIISADGSDTLKILEQRPGDTDKPEKTVATADYEGLIDELRGILKELPTEQPPGSEDIYGLDTGIAWAGNDDDGWVWTNGGPQGCVGGESFVQASADQKAQFARAADIVYEIANP